MACSCQNNNQGEQPTLIEKIEEKIEDVKKIWNETSEESNTESKE